MVSIWFGLNTLSLTIKAGVFAMNEICDFCGDPIIPGQNILRYSENKIDESGDPFSASHEEFIFCSSICAGGFLVKRLCESTTYSEEEDPE